MDYLKQLKSCPHCSSNNLKIKEKKGSYKIVCLECGSSSPYSYTKEDAVEVWNTRQSAQELFVEMLRQSEYCTNYNVHEDTVSIHGEPYEVNVVSFLSQEDTPLNAIFLKSTEDLILIETGKVG